jgi:hypothetical protein
MTQPGVLVFQRSLLMIAMLVTRNAGKRWSSRRIRFTGIRDEWVSIRQEIGYRMGFPAPVLLDIAL